MKPGPRTSPEKVPQNPRMKPPKPKRLARTNLPKTPLSMISKMTWKQMATMMQLKMP